MRPVVIHDPDLQLSAIVDTETLTAWGPTMFGDDGRRLLGAWLESLPADPAGLPSDVALAWFVNWLDASGQMPTEAPTAPQESADGPPIPTPGPDAALAAHEAQMTGDGPPPPQPADSDPTAGPGPMSAESREAGMAGGPEAVEPAPNGELAPAAVAAPPAADPPAAPAPATTLAQCSTCGGTGVLTFDGEDGPVSQGCAICHGTGRVTVEA